VSGCAERAAKPTGLIQEILQSGYWVFSAETYCLGGIRQPENRESAQYAVQSRVFPNRAETAAKRVFIRIRTDFNFAGVPFSGSLKAGFPANLPSPTRNTP